MSTAVNRRDVFLDETGHAAYVVEAELETLGLAINVTDGILLDWGTASEVAGRYKSTYTQACKAGRAKNDKQPALALLAPFATDTTAEGRCYIAKRARMGNASEFLKALKRLYGEPEYRNWPQAETARVPLDLRATA